MQVSGYVASHSSSSVFVILAKGLTARVALKHLADRAVEDPQAAFPLGKLVTGRISKAETDRQAYWCSGPASSAGFVVTRLSQRLNGVHSDIDRLEPIC